MEKITTLREVEESWSMQDVFDANDALDAWHEAQAAAKAKQ